MATEPKVESSALRRYRVVRPIRDFQDEMDLQARIGVAVANSGGHEVYYQHEAAARKARGRQFSSFGTHCLVDLLVVTRPGWSRRRPEDGREIPALGIEVKLAKDLDWVRRGVRQVGGYRETAPDTRFSHLGKDLPSPTHFALVTDHSWTNGHFYEWLNPEFAPAWKCKALAADAKCTEDEARWILLDQAWLALTAGWEAALIHEGLSILKGPDGAFSTNRFGHRRLYTLNDRDGYIAQDPEPPPEPAYPEPADYGKRLRELLGGGK